MKKMLIICLESLPPSLKLLRTGRLKTGVYPELYRRGFHYNLNAARLRMIIAIMFCFLSFFNEVGLCNKKTDNSISAQKALINDKGCINTSVKSIEDQKDMPAEIQKVTPVKKFVLDNGLTVLVKEMHNVPKVSLQIWYNVGSKDEKSGEKGIAHLIEHMIFKGTKKLSESDINIVSHKLSGGINAFTSHDYTGYLFNFPTHHWQEVLPIMADCMQNVAFKDEHLNSEMKAVIQELKMYKDDYQMSLVEELIATIFPDHPYHYPIIGFKQDLWSVRGADLHAFYKKHYAPNNATLVVVGDVNPDEVHKLAQQYFSAIEPNPTYKKEKHYHNKDLVSKSVTLYRDIQQPLVGLVFVLPGVTQKNEQVLEIASWILGAGKSARLYKRLVDDLKLVTSMSTSYWDLFEHSLFFIMYEPKSIKDVPAIEHEIYKEIDDIVSNGLSDIELERAIKKAQMKLYNVLESSEKQAYDIGKYYLATGDENYIYNYLNIDQSTLASDVVDLLRTYFRTTVAHKGIILPLPEKEKENWTLLQKLSDQEDERILSVRQRNTHVEGEKYAKDVKIKDATKFNYPKAHSFKISNGLKVLYYDNRNELPTINLVLDFKARPYYDSATLPGLYNFVMEMLTEGTENYTAAQLAHEIESRGMSIKPTVGGISMSMLSSDLPKGLEILQEVLTKATFDQTEIEKVREQIEVDIKNFWDEPSSFASQIVREKLYKDHPYAKNLLGTTQSIAKITRDDLIAFYKQMLSPYQAKLAIVGDLKNYDLKKLVERYLGCWQGPEVETLECPELTVVDDGQVNYPINRDQVVLCIAGLSIDRKHPDFDKLLLFDQIFGNGVLGSLHSRLFQLREQSGLFYTIKGSLLAQSDEQPGMVFIKTIVSLDRLKEAENAIKQTIEHVADSITDQEFEQARHAIVNGMVDNFETNKNMAYVFLWLDRFNFPSDFFDTRAEQLKKVSKADMQEAVKKVLKLDSLMTFRIGRIEKKSQESEASYPAAALSTNYGGTAN